MDLIGPKQARNSIKILMVHHEKTIVTHTYNKEQGISLKYLVMSAICSLSETFMSAFENVFFFIYSNNSDKTESINISCRC